MCREHSGKNVFLLRAKDFIHVSLRSDRGFYMFRTDGRTDAGSNRWNTAPTICFGQRERAEETHVDNEALRMTSLARRACRVVVDRNVPPEHGSSA